MPFALLQAIADVPEDSLRRGLGHLQAAEFLYETSLFPDLEYTFKHALTHEVAYGSLLQERRRALHARIVDAIEALYPERLAEHVERLAHHAFRGELWEKAVRYLRQAGRQGARRARPTARRPSCFEQALRRPRARCRRAASTLEQAIDLRLDLRHGALPARRVRASAGAPRAKPSASPRRSATDDALGEVASAFMSDASSADSASRTRRSSSASARWRSPSARRSWRSEARRELLPGHGTTTSRATIARADRAPRERSRGARRTTGVRERFGLADVLPSISRRPAWP